MKSKKTRNGSLDDRNTWFVQELAEFSVSAGRDDSRLLITCDRFRAGEMSEAEIQRYKLAAIDYIATRLALAPLSEQETYFRFLLQSELISESTDVRNALYMLLESRLDIPLDKLSLNIITSLLRSRRPPSDNLLRIVRGKLREQHATAPSWGYVGALAALVGRAVEPPYTVSELIQDVALLADSPDFDRALHLRNPIWMGLKPPLDSISILTQIRRTQSKHRHRYPLVKTPDYSSATDDLRRSIVRS